MFKQFSKGFTTIELLVVVGIIGLLATLAIISLQDSRERARDAKRLADMSQMEKALELYYIDNGRFPTVGGGEWAHSTHSTWATLESELGPYISGGELPPDPINEDNYPYQRYQYNSDTIDNYQTFGLRTHLEHEDNAQLMVDDPAVGSPDAQYYEIGGQPDYCATTFSETWMDYDTSIICEAPVIVGP